MKLSKSKIVFSVSFFLVFIVGCFIGLMASSYLYYRHVFSKTVYRNAIELASQINKVCQLRLGETDAVIKDLERMIDSNIISVALTPHIPETDYRHKALRAAKTYREIYPSESSVASQVADALKEIPKIGTFKCDSSLCRLVKSAASQKDE